MPEKLKKRYTFSREMFGNLREMELLRKDWEYQLNEAEILLFAYGKNGYRKIHSEFYNWMMSAPEEEKSWNWEIFCEHMMVCFVYTYFCGAVYDGEIFVNVQMAAASVSVIWDLLAVRWLKNEKSLDAEDVKEIVYRYSRELEHSDENREHFRRKLKKQRKIYL